MMKLSDGCAGYGYDDLHGNKRIANRSDYYIIGVITDMHHTPSFARTHSLAFIPLSPVCSGPIVLFSSAMDSKRARWKFQLPPKSLSVAGLHPAMLPRSGCCTCCKHVVPSPSACQSHPLRSASF